MDSGTRLQDDLRGGKKRGELTWEMARSERKEVPLSMPWIL
jgi:hypothetical protein